VPVPINESERSCNSVVCVSILSLSTIVPLDFETVSCLFSFLRVCYRKMTRQIDNLYH
jgi:hypothetical protein